MKAITTTASKALRILDNIMEGCTEWFAKDEHHSASLEYSRVGGDYEIITAKFYGTGATVRKLKFVDIDDALGYLASNHYYNVAGNPAEEPKPEVEPEPEAKPAPYSELIGMKLHKYDTWNGGSTTITIETTEHSADSSSVKFTGTNNWGKEESIYIAECLIPELILTGGAELKQEIDHCTVRKTWTLQ